MINWQTIFQSCYIILSPWTVYEWSVFSTSLPAFGGIKVFILFIVLGMLLHHYMLHYITCYTITSNGVIRITLDGSYVDYLFHVLICHLYIVFGEMSYFYCWILSSSYILFEVYSFQILFPTIVANLFIFFTECFA